MDKVIKLEVRDGISYASSKVIALELDIEHRALMQTIKKHQVAIESSFGRVAFEMLPFGTDGGTQNSNVAYLTEDQAIFVGTLSRNSETVVQFKARLVKAFQDAKRALQSTSQAMVPTSIEEMMILQLQGMIETKKRISEVEDKVKILEAKSTTRPDVFTIIGYATLHGVKVGLSLAAQLGKKAKAICNEKGIVVDKIHDPRFGQIGVYPADVLKEVFDNQMY